MLVPLPSRGAGGVLVLNFNLPSLEIYSSIELFGLISSKMIASRMEYIHDNPVRTGWVLNMEDYLYTSA